MSELFSVFIGGGLGALLRYLLGTSLNDKVIFSWLSGIPLGTLFANWLGSFVLGLLMGVIPLSSPLKIGLTTGLMGGLTTFSTFSVEGAQLMSEGQIFRATLHLTLHVVGGVLLAMLGLSFGLNCGKEV
jgi:fluoride exporter